MIRKEETTKIKQMHLAERKAEIRPKQGRRVERDELMPLVNKYKQMLDKRANEGASAPVKLEETEVEASTILCWRFRDNLQASLGSICIDFLSGLGGGRSVA
ncbi:hypothetical protein EVAR_71458_1 [Eumeta japonica]|uniref:Uncharacterized protein n=1 Tax=Eumeta variegata TaxID=151549 RepID=A0A4C2A6Q5_EUMVA|nr:hypothetical protein EVAR_71458_1 [Eumeta japonica]